jgi:hypothetical protein
MIAAAICSNTLARLELVEAWFRLYTAKKGIRRKSLKGMRFDRTISRRRIFEKEAF